MFLTCSWMRIRQKWGWIVIVVIFFLLSALVAIKYLFLFVNASRIKIRVKLWQPMFSRLFCFDIWSVLIQHRTPAQVARVLDFGAKFQIVEIRILRETEGLQFRKFPWFLNVCYKAGNSNAFLFKFLLVIQFANNPNFNTFQTQRRSRWDEINRPVKYTYCCNRL